MVNNLHFDLPFDIGFDGIDEFHLLKHHVTDALTHSLMSLLPLVGPSFSLLFLLRIDTFFMHDFILVFVKVSLHILGDFA